MIEIRPARPGDGELLLQAARALAAFHNREQDVLARAIDYEAALFTEKPIVFGLLAFVDGAFAGSILWHRSFSSFAGRDVIYLEDISVLPPYQHRGVGQALMKTLARIADRDGFESISWNVSSWNAAAKAFYRKLGAVIEPGMEFCQLKGGALKALTQ